MFALDRETAILVGVVVCIAASVYMYRKLKNSKQDIIRRSLTSSKVGGQALQTQLDGYDFSFHRRAVHNLVFHESLRFGIDIARIDGCGVGGTLRVGGRNRHTFATRFASNDGQLHVLDLDAHILRSPRTKRIRLHPSVDGQGMHLGPPLFPRLLPDWVLPLVKDRTFRLLSCVVLQSKQTLFQQVLRVRNSFDRGSRSNLIAVLDGIVVSSTHK
jgi:hypothetical protein